MELTYPYCNIGILGQVWCLVVSIPDLCPLSYFQTIPSPFVNIICALVLASIVLSVRNPNISAFALSHLKKLFHNLESLMFPAFFANMVLLFCCVSLFKLSW